MEKGSFLPTRFSFLLWELSSICGMTCHKQPCSYNQTLSNEPNPKEINIKSLLLSMYTQKPQRMSTMVKNMALRSERPSI